MTTTPKPGIMELLDGTFDSTGDWHYRQLHARLAPIAAILDKYPEASRVVLEGLEESLTRVAYTTPGTWFAQDEGQPHELGIMSSERNSKQRIYQITRSYTVPSPDATLIVHLRNLIHRASQAAQAATEKP